MLSEQFIGELKERNDIEEVVSSYVNVKRRGRNLVGLCPFHFRKNPVFHCLPRQSVFLLLWLRHRRRCCHLCTADGKSGLY